MTLTVTDRYTPEQVAAYKAKGLWEDSTLFDVISEQARERPDKAFMFDSTTSVTYAELRDRALRIAAGLRRAGVHAGERIAVQLPNITEFVVAAAAINRAGAVLVPIMPIYRGSEVKHFLAHSGATRVITMADFGGFAYVDMFRQMQSELPQLKTIWAVRGGVEGAEPFEALEVNGEPDALAVEVGDDRHPDEPFLIVYTSGTTSKPKGCVHTFNTARTAAKELTVGLRYSSEDVQFGPSPISHSTGMATSILLPLINGASSLFIEKWDPVAGMDALIEHKVTCAVTATPFLQMLLGVYDPDRHDVSHFRAWVCAGSPIPGSVVEKARKMFTGGTVLSLLGRSENYVTTMCSVDDDPQRAVTSDGRALPDADVQITDPLGNEVPRGEEGDIAYKGASHMLGYYNDPDATAAMFTPSGYSQSGDLGVMDKDGFVRVTGRSKDIIIRGGMNISAREVEDHVGARDDIAQVAAVAMPDERLGEKVCLYVVPVDVSSAPTLEVINEDLRFRGVATQKLPERLEVVEALPMTATGKIQKHLLRAEIAEKVKADSAS
ncbi:AMP-binding protein [Janibacter sp. YIM B02568]|uniref:AMP-binding protein n=1 Tax=Janibacter endophyticus TaxID=2806261 RepID=UPI00194F0C94|nr:AMP-binding protein [Janibacter endophyticus]MBM6545420.1 AMP-binding protein [Janibacter endophyticus]